MTLKLNSWVLISIATSLPYLLPLKDIGTTNLVLNSSFETIIDAKTYKPLSWQLEDSGMSIITEERSYRDKKSLKIVDKSTKEGSNVYSNRFQVKRSCRYVVWLYSYLMEGEPGLGVYLRFWDKEGKLLYEASERTCHTATMKINCWLPTQFVVKPPDDAETAALWLHTYSTALLSCYVDEVRVLEVSAEESFEELEQWRGGTIETKIVKSGKYSVCWQHSISSQIVCSYPQPQDLSKFGALSFWLYSKKATGSAFMLIISSENTATDGIDYYSFRIVLNWEGRWRKFILPFAELSVTRQPIGWHKIDSIYFTASGWGNTPHPDAVVYLDGFEAIPMPDVKGPRLTDVEFFKTLNLELPALRRVAMAIKKNDIKAAKRALASHIKARKYPRWFFDWREHPFLGVKEVPKQDKAPQQWDYFSLYINIDWEGWKHFSFEKADFSPKAFVEGEGWRGKKPIGWGWIRYILFSASGWGLKPDAATVLYFDDIKLVGKTKEVIISDFEHEPIYWEGLERSSEKAKRGKFSGKWKHQINSSIRCWKIPHDWREFDKLEFWAYSEKATGSKIILVLDSDVGKFSEADDLCQRKFSYGFLGAERFEIQFGEKIDWKANPTKGEARTHLWNEALNRHFHFNTLADAYWYSGDEKYAKELVAQWLDWIEQNHVPLLTSGNEVAWPYGSYAWQTLTAAIRIGDTWPNAFYRCLGSPSFTDEAIITILKSVYDHANHLIRWPTSLNWLTQESVGLFTAGVLFPEFKDAILWRKVALQRLYKQLDEEVYPDGMQYELAVGYNTWVVSNFVKVIDLAELNNLQKELPKDYMVKLEKIFNYLLYAAMPDGAIPGLNDSGNTDVRGLLRKGYKLFPKREDFLYVATAGKQGKLPEHTSYAFPYTGHYVMRSGWQPAEEVLYLLFDSGPYGAAHQHEDKLHFVLYAYNKQHVLDPGNYSYDASKWRRYVISTAAHNTIMVNGQGQNRSAKLQTHVWKKPWKLPRPPEDDTRWVSTKEYDYAKGTYKDGYGPTNDTSVTHTRSIFFVKPENMQQQRQQVAYWIIVDTLRATDQKPHLYESLFHLDTESAKVVDEQSKIVCTENKAHSNLFIIPLPDADLKVEIIKGQEQPHPQGWANHPWRAIPTAIFSK